MHGTKLSKRQDRLTGDRYEALLEVLEQQERQAEEDRRRDQRSARRARRSPLWRLLLLTALAGWVWLAPPPVLRVAEAPDRPVAEEEAAVRFGVYVQAQRIEAFLDQRGRLPETLDEVGPPLPGMEYARLAGRLYQLTGVTDRVRLTYRSDLPLAEFVGSGANVLDEARIP